jgi:hypothetical protein
MHIDNLVYAVVSGRVKYMYTVLSGVLQGCPLSATLFGMALNMFLVLAHSLGIVKLMVRAARDDLGRVYCSP